MQTVLKDKKGLCLENQDITVKNLLIVGFLVMGLFAWSKVDFSPSLLQFNNFENTVSFERNPTAIKNKIDVISIQKVSSSEYKPDLKVFDTNRVETSSNLVEDNINENTASQELKTSEFESTRNEISVLMASGKIEEAVDLARDRLEENISKSNEAVYMGYLQDFIMQNMHNPEEQYNLTLISIKNAQEPAMKKQLIQKFSAYQPEMAEQMKQEVQLSIFTEN